MPMLRVRNPFDQSEIARVLIAGEPEIAAALDAAADAFREVRHWPGHQRSAMLSRVAAALQSRRDEFAMTIVNEAGKPITLAEAEVDRAIVTFTAAAEEARHNGGEWLDLDGFASGAGHAGFVKRFPLGIIYGVAPFNFPLNLVAHKVAPALASGNVILIKPSPRTPLSAMKLAEVIREAGAAAGQMQTIVMPNELAMRPLADPRVKMISFTGSAPIGWEVKRKSGEKRVTLELGGNAALIVHEDADISAAAKAAASGAFGYAGQSCISVQRIFVQKKIYDPFRDALLDQIRTSIHAGDPKNRDVLVGPMIDAAAAQRVTDTIAAAVAGGARVLIGNNPNGTLYPPTLVENADFKSKLYADEIFAPVATLHPYDTFDEAIGMANDSAFGLQAGVFTQNISLAWRAFELLDVGGVLINQAPTWRSDIMPYGGVKQSGLGREGVRYAMREMTEPRALVMNVGSITSGR